MASSGYSGADPQTGNVTWHGPLQDVKGDHRHMPARTEAYRPGDERGHVNASSLGGGNTRSNVAAQHRDVNHGAYLSMERGERNALRGGAAIQSEKTAIVNDGPGGRPVAFQVNDSVTYADGRTQELHHSFTNESCLDQSAWNGASAALPGTFDGPNPGDGLRESMDAGSYARLMEETDAALPAVSQDYAEADFAGLPGMETNAGVEDTGPGAEDGPGADAGNDSGADPDPD